MQPCKCKGKKLFILLKEKNRKRARDGSPQDGRPKEKRSRDLIEIEERNGYRSDDSPERFSIPPPPPPSVARNIPSMLTPSISLPEISPVYKPLPRPPIESRHAASEDERLGVLMGQKKTRSAVYSGKKRTRFFQEVPSLFEQCIMVLQDHVDDIDEVGNLNYDVLETVLERASPKTLMHIEDLNTHLMTGPTNTSKLWEKHCMRDFRSKEREEMESWREMYERCTQQRQDKLDKLKVSVYTVL
ncbi:elongin-A [Eurytemora carolleeae]|uniref:elongin-A n=1 Tax=Eurytemora carolleeae TaxID=1294199 RepID=UPI000C75E123|nr:elongin-A [Eurytemora carolleeae]|eukprot:XP_023324451.1 elongin-A-like [Eurytemora affinis]